MISGNVRQSETQLYRQTKTAKAQQLSTTVLTAKTFKQSRRLTKSQLEGGGSQISFVAYQVKEGAQVFLHSHSCESLEYRTLLGGFSFAIVTAIDVMSIFLGYESDGDLMPASRLTGT